MSLLLRFRQFNELQNLTLKDVLWCTTCQIIISNFIAQFVPTIANSMTGAHFVLVSKKNKKHQTFIPSSYAKKILFNFTAEKIYLFIYGLFICFDKLKMSRLIQHVRQIAHRFYFFMKYNFFFAFFFLFISQVASSST